MTAADPIGPAGDDAGWCRWRLALRVEPLLGDPFAATAAADLPDGERPAIGGCVEVLHGPPRRRWSNRASRGVPIGTLLLGAPPAAAGEEPAQGVDEEAPGPSAGDVLRALSQGLRDGSLAAGAPMIVTSPRDAPAAATAAAGAESREAYRRVGLEALAARARGDAAGVADEVVRRLDAGEATPAQVLAAARAAALAPGDLLSVLAAVRARRP